MSLENEHDRALSRIAILESALEQAKMELGAERSHVRSLVSRLERSQQDAVNCDNLQVQAMAELATVRLALEAPNPCNLTEWAGKVKARAGRMDDDIESQAFASRVERGAMPL